MKVRGGGQMELLMKHSHLFKEVKVYHHNHGVNLILSLARVPGSPVCDRMLEIYQGCSLWANVSYINNMDIYKGLFWSLTWGKGRV